MIHPVIFSISELFIKKGIRHVVQSPGSRNAPLTISFARNPNIRMFSIVDERSAGFIALGMSLKLREPVVLCCTSGTALLNYAPAVAEAHYQQVPLIILSADRPPEWLDQRDGQTINQPGALHNFVKKTYQLPVSYEHSDSQWEVNFKLNEAVNLSNEGIKGPVHINLPFREPFYPTPEQKLEFGSPRVFSIEQPKVRADWETLTKSWQSLKKRLIVAGQSMGTDLELGSCQTLLADVISNCSSPGAIRHHDLFLSNISKGQAEALQPDLLVTFGKSVISKNLKVFLRKNPPKEHWHFDPDGFQIDTYQQVTSIVKGDFVDFYRSLPEEKTDAFTTQLQSNYHQSWAILESKTQKVLESGFEGHPFSEMQVYKEVMKTLPHSIDLHVANSMTVRYANFFQGLKKDVEVFSNRGTSGIDGTNGTAVGNALIGEKPVVLLTGDLSFFYDRNCFFHGYDLSKLKIIISNNYGGGIFRLIKGPADQPELETYFETRHSHTAKFTAAEYGFDYFKAESLKSLQSGLKQLFKDDKAPKILEVFTDPIHNQDVFQSIKNKI